MSRTCTHMLFHLWNYFLLTSYTEIIPCRVQQAGTLVLHKRDTIKYRARAVWYVEDDFHTWPFCVFDDRWFVFGSDLRLGLESSQIFRTRPESVKYKVTLVSLEPLWWHSFFFLVCFAKPQILYWHPALWSPKLTVFEKNIWSDPSSWKTECFRI